MVRAIYLPKVYYNNKPTTLFNLNVKQLRYKKYLTVSKGITYNKYSSGLIEEKGKKMIVTNGIGVSILPIRFNCPPEVVVIEL